MELKPPELPLALSARFRLDALLASGGFGAVWRATDLLAHREVALKVLHQHTLADENQVERFLQEARAASYLEHPSIVTVLAHGVEEGVPFIAYDLVEGDSLRQQIDRGPLAIPRAVLLAEQVASALGCAHAAGIIHRDVKPENILCRGESRALLTDFGVARWIGGRVKTQTGVILGTPFYMPLEVLKGDPPTPAADVYAAGVLLFEMLTGRLPIEGTSPLDILRHLVKDVPPSLSSRLPGAPPALDALLSRALAREPAERFCDGTELAGALAALLAHGGAALVAPPAPEPSRASHAPSRSSGPTRAISRAGASSRATSHAASRDSATLVSRAPAHPPTMRALGPVAALTILAISALSAGVVLRRAVGVPASPGAAAPAAARASAAREPAAVTIPHSGYEELSRRVADARRRRSDKEALVLARHAIEAFARLPRAARPLVDPELFATCVESVTSELAPHSRPGRALAGNWFLLFRPEWFRDEDDEEEHRERERTGKRDEPAHHKRDRHWGGPPRSLTAFETARVSWRVRAALEWLPDAAVRSLGESASLVIEARLVHRLALLHMIALDWPDQPLAPALDRAFHTFGTAHPDRWSAHYLEMRRLAPTRNLQPCLAALFRARDLFDRRHIPERRAGRVESDELCALMIQACALTIPHLRPNTHGSPGQYLTRGRAHLEEPPVASQAARSALNEISMYFRVVTLNETRGPR